MEGAGIELEGSYRTTKKGNSDWWYGGGAEAWTDLATALAAIPVVKRPGLTIGIYNASATLIQEYWWKDSSMIADNDLQLKFSVNSITLSGDVTGTGSNSIVTTIGAGKIINSMLAGNIPASKLVQTDIVLTESQITNLTTDLAGKQSLLISGTNIKSINSGTLLGSGNINLQTPLIANTDYLTPTGSAVGLTNFPIFNQNTTGSASTLTTPRTINGVAFNGSSNIIITATPSGVAGGDLIGNYPNPTIVTINGITKNFFDPTSSIQTQLNAKENLSNKGIANGYVPLNSSTKVDSIYLPSYVDTITEVANYAALPTTGDTGTVYVTLDTGYQYRWGGTTYTRIVSSPGTTDDLAEGASNLYYTNTRVSTYGDGRYQPIGNYILSLVGDATASGPGNSLLTLASVNSSPGTIGSASTSNLITVNNKGLVTSVTSTPITIVESQVVNLVSDLAGKQPILGYTAANDSNVVKLTGLSTQTKTGNLKILSPDGTGDILTIGQVGDSNNSLRIYGRSDFTKTVSIVDELSEVAFSVVSYIGTAIAAYGYSYFGGGSFTDFEHDIHVKEGSHIKLYDHPIDPQDAVRLVDLTNLDNGVVHKTGNETIGGEKTFNDLAYFNSGFNTTANLHGYNGSTPTWTITNSGVGTFGTVRSNSISQFLSGSDPLGHFNTPNLQSGSYILDNGGSGVDIPNAPFNGHGVYAYTFTVLANGGYDLQFATVSSSAADNPYLGKMAYRRDGRNSGGGLGEWQIIVTKDYADATYLTSSSTVTLSGDVSGTGSTSIVTSIGDNKVTNNMLTGSITASKLVGTDIVLTETQITNLVSDLAAKQATLVSGTNIKTINSGSILGSGDIVLQTPLTAGTDYLTPSGSAAGLTSFPILNQNTTGSAATLTTPRNINGVPFDGSSNITIGATPSGSASGELSGSYPNPTLVNSAVIGKLLTGYTSGTGVITATDSILSAIQKLNGNIDTLTGGTLNYIQKSTGSGLINSQAYDDGTLFGINTTKQTFSIGQYFTDVAVSTKMNVRGSTTDSNLGFVVTDSSDRPVMGITNTGRVDISNYNISGGVLVLYNKSTSTNGMTAGHFAIGAKNSLGNLNTISSITTVVTDRTAATNNSQMRFAIQVDEDTTTNYNQPNVTTTYDKGGWISPLSYTVAKNGSNTIAPYFQLTNTAGNQASAFQLNTAYDIDIYGYGAGGWQKTNTFGLNGGITTYDYTTSDSELFTLRAQYGSGFKKAITWRDTSNITTQIDSRYNAGAGTIDLVFGHFYNGGYQTSDLYRFGANGNFYVLSGNITASASNYTSGGYDMIVRNQTTGTFEKVAAISNINPMTTLGDIIYGGISGTPTRLAGNTATSNLFLTSTGTGSASAAPSYFDLFGSNNIFTGYNRFNIQTDFYGGITLRNQSIGFYNSAGTFGATLAMPTITSTRLLTLPDASGTVALLQSVNSWTNDNAWSGNITFNHTSAINNQMRYINNVDAFFGTTSTGYGLYFDGSYLNIYNGVGGANALRIQQSTNAAIFSASVTSSAFITSGGTASQVVLGNGTLGTFSSVSGTTTYLPVFTGTNSIGNSNFVTTGYSIAPINNSNQLVFLGNTALGGSALVLSGKSGTNASATTIRFGDDSRTVSNMQAQTNGVGFGVLSYSSDFTGTGSIKRFLTIGIDGNTMMGNDDGSTVTYAGEKLQVLGNIEALNGNGLILKSPDGTRWRITIDNSGALVRTSL